MQITFMSLLKKSIQHKPFNIHTSFTKCCDTLAEREKKKEIINKNVIFAD